MDPEEGKDNKAYIPEWDNMTDKRQDLDSSNSEETSSQTEDKQEDENGGRETFDKPIEFLLTCISMSVGLGNIWRFPFTAYKNGGGAFLIPYLIILTFFGRPIYFLEMCLGQFSSFGQVKMWSLSPIFKGVGYGSTFGSICALAYYVSIMAQCAFYFFASFAKDLPWSVCNPDWGQNLCLPNGTINETANAGGRSLAALYYDLEVFPKRDDIDSGLGSPDWRLSLCLLLCYTLLFLSMWKGVRSSGKVAYFTALFPYLVLVILLIRGVTLEGAWVGIRYFIEPQWDKMLDAKVWYAAVSQCFFSLGTGFGTIAMFSSFNRFRHNIYRDALIISLTDTITSILAGCTIFSVLGHLSVLTGIDIDKVTDGGPGLAFVSYPETIAKFSFVPQLFAVLFFLMLVTLSVGSAGSYAAAAITLICDQFPSWPRSWVTLGVCVAGFFSGLMFVTPGGPFMVDLVDHFGSGFIIFVMAMVEVAAVSWIYGLNNFCRDIHFMLGIQVGWYWKACWGAIIPVGLLVILVYALATMGRLTFGDVAYPDSAIASGWVLTVVGLSFIPVLAIIATLKRQEDGSVKKFLAALKPTAAWGPANPKTRQEWEAFKNSTK